MIVSAKLRHLFDEYQVDFQVLHHLPTVDLLHAANALNLPISQVLCAQLVAHQEGHCLLVWPLDRELVLSKLDHLLSAQLLSPHACAHWFPDCEPGVIPAIGEPYGLPLLVDQTVRDLAEIYFASGSLRSFVRLSGEDYQFLLVQAKYVSFTVPKQAAQVPVMNFGKGCAAAYALDLPALPTKVLSRQEITELRATEPFLESMLLGLERLLKHSAFPEEPEIGLLARVLLGAKRYRIQMHGPLGARAFWRHALLSAVLVRELVLQFQLELEGTLALMVGFFHNIGYLVFGHLFAPEFQLLNRMYLSTPGLPIEQQEKRLLGMGDAQPLLQQGHTVLGSWLSQQWQLPEPIALVAQCHHQEQYTGPYQEIIAVTFLGDQLLRQSDLGEGRLGPLSAYYLQLLGTKSSLLESIAARFLNPELEPRAVAS